ncbi:hypothetical protein MHYP_G00236730 [Metynnis hypsauchen]
MRKGKFTLQEGISGTQTIGLIKALEQVSTFSKQHSRIMKTLLVTLLAMLLMSGSALKCKNGPLHYHHGNL